VDEIQGVGTVDVKEGRGRNIVYIIYLVHFFREPVAVLSFRTVGPKGKEDHAKAEQEAIERKKQAAEEQREDSEWKAVELDMLKTIKDEIKGMREL
jgi:hypothetical protein